MDFRMTAGAASALMLALASPVFADDVGDWYVAPGAVHFDDDPDRAVDDGFAGGQIAIGKAISEHFNMEFFGNSVDLDGVIDQDSQEFGLNFLGIANREASWTPFFLAGFSHVSDDIGADDDSSLGLSVGAGMLWRFGESPVSFRGDWKLRTALAGREFKDRLATLGIQVDIGGGKPRVVDTDGDGVPDDADQCPNTPLGAAVDARGCELDDDRDGVVNSKDECPNTPAGTPVDARGCSAADSDGDGVIDTDDQCPNTPAGARVDARGCELDDDGDGIINSKDLCPNTTAGARVDVNGCEITEVIELPGVNFGSNSDELLPGSERVLDDAAATLRRYPELIVQVAGHTDSDGSAAYNEGLSERRAETVMNYLIDRGANAANLSARGYGEAEPIADNATATGKAANRRVELRIREQ